MEELIKAIEGKREEQDLNDAELCRLLGIDPGYWSRVKSEKQEVGKKLLSAVMREFPTLQDAVIKYMSRKQEEK